MKQVSPLPTNDPFRHWREMMEATSESLRFFQENYESALSEDEQNIFNEGGQTLFIVGDIKFKPEFQPFPVILAYIDKIAKLCDLMVSKYAPDVYANTSPQAQFADNMIMTRTRMAGLPPQRILDTICDYPSFSAHTLYEEHHAHCQKTGGTILSQIASMQSGHGLPIM